MTVVTWRRCRENCGRKRSTRDAIILDAECNDYCDTPAGDVSYVWSLFYVDDADVEHEYTNLEEISLTGARTRNDVIMHKYDVHTRTCM